MIFFLNIIFFYVYNLIVTGYDWDYREIGNATLAD